MAEREKGHVTKQHTSPSVSQTFPGRHVGAGWTGRDLHFGERTPLVGTSQRVCVWAWGRGRPSRQAFRPSMFYVETWSLERGAASSDDQ